MTGLSTETLLDACLTAQTWWAITDHGKEDKFVRQFIKFERVLRERLTELERENAELKAYCRSNTFTLTY
jgi:hypothetical protein